MTPRARTRGLLYAPWTPWGALARRLRPRALVLVYHRVAEPELDPFSLAVPPTLFERHLEALARHFAPLGLEDLLERLESGRCPDGAVAVTFDDGYADNLTAAQPIAAARGVPITLFVTTDPVLEGRPFWWDELTRAAARLRGGPAVRVELGEGPEGGHTFGEGADPVAAVKSLQRALLPLPPGDPERERVMRALRDLPGDGPEPRDGGRPLTPAELRELASRTGVTIGAHSVRHPSLRHVPEEECVFELVESRARLERVLGRPVRLFAYPFGRARDVDERTARLAERAGYRAAFTTGGAALTSRSLREPLALPRITVFAWTAEALVGNLRRALDG